MNNPRPETLTKSEIWVYPTPEEIRFVISKIGRTQVSIASILNISRRTVVRWVNGEKQISYTDWTCLCYLAGYGFIMFDE